jgi:hypothetical protein
MALQVTGADTRPRDGRQGARRWQRAGELLWVPLGAAEARPLLAFALVGLVCVGAYLTGVLAIPSRNGRVINGDAIQYFAYLQSVVVDGDLDFSNDYQQLSWGSNPPKEVDLNRTVTGRLPNKMSVGPAILWSPFYVTARVVLRAVGAGGPRAVVLQQVSVGIAGIVYATLGAWFMFLACERLFPRRAAFWAALVVWLAGPAVYYSLVSPTYSHATSMFAVSAFVFAWLATRGGQGYGRWILLGALGSLAGLVRWQDAVVLLLPAGEALAAVWRRQIHIGAAALRLAAMSGAAGIVFIPQLVAWNALYGTPLLIPQGSGFMQWGTPAIVGVLFSLRRGLFSWTPALLAGAVGFPFVIRRDRLAGWLMLILLIGAVYVNASVQDWWAGEAYGARRFIGFGVFLALGLAALMSLPRAAMRPRAVAWLSVAAIVYNLLFVVQYQLFMRGMRDLVPYPETAPQVFFDRLWLPAWLLLRWLWN